MGCFLPVVEAKAASQNEALVNMAKSQLGIKERSSNSDDILYNDWYYGYRVNNNGVSAKYAWCAVFVSWCANQAGIPVNIIPKTANTTNMKNLLISNGGTSHLKGDGYIPQCGDIIFFGSNASQHVGIVEYATQSTVYYIDGNNTQTDPHGVHYSNCSLSYSNLWGFVTPKYSYSSSDENAISTPHLTLNASTSDISSQTGFSLNWTQSTGDIHGYNLYLARQIEGTNNYNWDNARIYLPGAESNSYTISAGALSAGAYSAYVQAWNIVTDKKSNQSNFIYFTIHDDILSDVHAPNSGNTYDVSKESFIQVSGWAINTGRHKVKCYAYIDNKREQLLSSIVRDDVYYSPLYSAYCSDNMVGFLDYVSLEGIETGTHILKIIAVSDTKTAVIASKSFNVIASECTHSSKITDKENVVNGTCTASGKYEEVVYCTECEKELSRTVKVTSALGHSWNVGTVTKASTCVQKGTKTYTCTQCGITKSEEIPINTTNHTGKTEVRNKIAATCSATGYTGDTYCKDCNTKLSAGNTIAKTNHLSGMAVKENITASACTSVGQYDEVVYCVICDKELSRETKVAEAIGHTWDDGKIIEEATCVQNGIKSYTCIVCNENKTEEIRINSNNHTGNMEIRNKKAASCTETGYTGDVYCKDCNMQMAAGTVMPKLEHIYTWIVDNMPTTVQTGSKHEECSLCGGKRNENTVIEKLPVQTEILLGECYIVENMKYIITNADVYGNGTVTLAGTTKKKTDKKFTSLIVGNTVNISGIPFKITAISDNAFANYTKIKKVRIGNNVSVLGKGSFSKCTKLTTVSIGTALKKISDKAFYGCKKLKQIEIKSKRLDRAGKKAIQKVSKKLKIKVPKSKKKAYKKLFSNKTGFNKKTMRIV